jgi:large subunit ribosomal protein L17
MRHGKKVAKLGRSHSHRKAMLANMATSLLQIGTIRTTHARAKELRVVAENMITFAKCGDLHARREVLRFIENKRVVTKLFDELGPRYKSRNGGYTRTVKIASRLGDGAPMCIIELVDRPAATEGERENGESGAAKSKEDEGVESNKT